MRPLSQVALGCASILGIIALIVILLTGGIAYTANKISEASNGWSTVEVERERTEQVRLVTNASVDIEVVRAKSSWPVASVTITLMLCVTTIIIFGTIVSRESVS